MTKKVIVIGAGVSGLVAGVYARLAGFDVEMYESHTVVGGNCTGWNRKGYHIDGCIQWLTGTKNGTGVNKIWRTCGALSDDTPIYNTEKIATTIYEGKTYHLYSDVNRIERDFLEISPDDKVIIKKFIKNIKRFKNLNAPVDKPFEEMSIFGFLPLIWKLIKSGKPEKETETMTIRDYIEEFKSPVIRHLLACVFPGEMPAYALFYSLGIRTSGDGGWPVGGSLAFMKRIQQHFEELGGKIHLGRAVDKIIVKDGVATGIRLKGDDSEIHADYIISAVDGEMLLRNFLENKYSDEYFKKRYYNEKDYLLLTGTYVSFGTTVDLSGYPHNVFVKTKSPLQLNNTVLNNFNVKIYNFDSKFTHEGKTVMAILLTENEFDYWKSLKENTPEKYKEEKQRIADWAMEGIIDVFPELEGKFDMTDVATPLTFNRYCNSFRGAYMSFIPYGNVKMEFHKGRIEGLKNLFLAGQGAIPVGGLPLAAIAGKFAVQRVIKADKEAT